MRCVDSVLERAPRLIAQVTIPWHHRVHTLVFMMYYTHRRTYYNAACILYSQTTKRGGTRGRASPCVSWRGDGVSGAVDHQRGARVLRGIGYPRKRLRPPAAMFDKAYYYTLVVRTCRWTQTRADVRIQYWVIMAVDWYDFYDSICS